ncbi:MAG: HAD hydrolase-like protein [Pseudomonadota bacterium]
MLVFDLDGTLSDPGEGICRCVNHALSLQGEPQADHEQIKALIGGQLDDIFRALLPVDHAVNMERLVSDYRDRMKSVGYSENELYAGIRAFLEKMREESVPMGVCTSKRKDIAEQVLAYLEIAHCFQFVSGGDVGIHKGAQLAQLLQEQRIDRQAVMVGDRSMDVRAAKENELRAVGVTWGFGTSEELADAGADFVATAVDDIEGAYRAAQVLRVDSSRRGSQ